MRRLKKVITIVFGTVLIMLGIAGLILPILNGTILLLLGLILISFESPYIEFHLNKIAHNNSMIGGWYEKLLKFMKRLFHRG